MEIKIVMYSDTDTAINHSDKNITNKEIDKLIKLGLNDRYGKDVK